MMARYLEKPYVSGSSRRQIRINAQQRRIVGPISCARLGCPIFFIPTKRNQLFCSPSCAKPGTPSRDDLAHEDVTLEYHPNSTAIRDGHNAMLQMSRELIARRESGDNTVTPYAYEEALILSTIDMRNWHLDTELGRYNTPRWWDTYKPLRSHPEQHLSKEYVNPYKHKASQ
jgi:hypothetical protein